MTLRAQVSITRIADQKGARTAYRGAIQLGDTRYGFFDSAEGNARYSSRCTPGSHQQHFYMLGDNDSPVASVLPEDTRIAPELRQAMSKAIILLQETSLPEATYDLGLEESGSKRKGMDFEDSLTVSGPWHIHSIRAVA